jgi:hypothetical protein
VQSSQSAFLGPDMRERHRSLLLAATLQSASQTLIIEFDQSIVMTRNFFLCRPHTSVSGYLTFTTVTVHDCPFKLFIAIMCLLDTVTGRLKPLGTVTMPSDSPPRPRQRRPGGRAARPDSDTKIIIQTVMRPPGSGGRRRRGLSPSRAPGRRRRGLSPSRGTPSRNFKFRLQLQVQEATVGGDRHSLPENCMVSDIIYLIYHRTLSLLLVHEYHHDSDDYDILDCD